MSKIPCLDVSTSSFLTLVETLGTVSLQELSDDVVSWQQRASADGMPVNSTGGSLTQGGMAAETP